MQGNDLANAPSARIVLVAEGALIFCDGKNQKRSQKMIEKGHYHDALDLWIVNDMMVTRIWDVARHTDFNIDVVTFLGPDGLAQAMAEWFDREDLPIRGVSASTPAIYGRKCTFRSDIVRVYTPFPEQVLMFGPKGRVITDVNQLGRD